MDKDLLQRDNVAQLLGPHGTPIPKLPSSEKRKIKAWLAVIEKSDTLEEPEFLLRAYLAIGKAPTPNIISDSIINNVLDFEDILRHAKKLCLSSPIIDATALFIGLQNSLLELKKDPKINPIIRKNIVALKKWLNWVISIQGTLSEETELALLDLLTSLMNIIFSLNKQSKRNLIKLNKTITPLVELSIKIAADSRYSETFIRTMKGLRIVSINVSSSFFEDIIENTICDELLEQALNKIPSYVKKAADEGRIDILDATLKSIDFMPTANSRFEATINNIVSEGLGKFSDEVQDFIRTYLNVDQKSALESIELLDKGESLQLSQLAMALLYSWEAQKDSAKASEAFQVIQSVAKKFFNIQIRGEVGNIVKFNPKIHEHSGSSIAKGQVVITRPWVEYNDGPYSRVMIRAIVKKA